MSDTTQAVSAWSASDFDATPLFTPEGYPALRVPFGFDSGLSVRLILVNATRHVVNMLHQGQDGQFHLAWSLPPCGQVAELHRWEDLHATSAGGVQMYRVAYSVPTFYERPEVVRTVDLGRVVLVSGKYLDAALLDGNLDPHLWAPGDVRSTPDGTRGATHLYRPVLGEGGDL